MPWYAYVIIGLIIWTLVSIPVAFYVGYLFSRRPDPNDFNYEPFNEELDEEDDWEFDEPLYDAVIGIHESLSYKDGQIWEEVEIDNSCGHGCKIYQSSKTGRRVLAHNSAYGCTVIA